MKFRSVLNGCGGGGGEGNDLLVHLCQTQNQLPYELESEKIDIKTFLLLVFSLSG